MRESTPHAPEGSSAPSPTDMVNLSRRCIMDGDRHQFFYIVFLYRHGLRINVMLGIDAACCFDGFTSHMERNHLLFYACCYIFYPVPSQSNFSQVILFMILHGECSVRMIFSNKATTGCNRCKISVCFKHRTCFTWHQSVWLLGTGKFISLACCLCIASNFFSTFKALQDELQTQSINQYLPLKFMALLPMIYSIHGMSRFNKQTMVSDGYLILQQTLDLHQGVIFRGRPLQWRHNGRVGVSNHQSRDCLLNRFMRRSKITSKHCTGNSPVTGEFPAEMASNAVNVSISWRHDALMI